MAEPVKLEFSLFWAVILCSLLILGSAAEATSPPDLPLPACVTIDEQQQGACPASNEYLTGKASGKLSANGGVEVEIVPTLPVCDEHIGHPPYPWTPGPCYAAVHAPVVLSSCGYIDLQDGDEIWRESSCASALYKDTRDAPSRMFRVGAAQDGAACGGKGNYGTYVWGGPANVPGARWSEFGPDRRKCEITFNGARPDGLYGPTWVKVRVGIDKAENGNQRRGYGEYAEFYVPIDGDMRESDIDVSVLATSLVRKEGDKLIVTYTATLTNNGEKEAKNVTLLALHPPTLELGDPVGTPDKQSVPVQLHVISFSDSRCIAVNQFIGGIMNCPGLTLEGKGDPRGGDVVFVDMVARITNASDLPSMIFRAIVPNDIDDSNNEDKTTATLNLQGGSLAQTRRAMEILEPHFDYKTPKLGTQCNVYRTDIYARFERIRLNHPEVFADLAYGPVTSGGYITEAGSAAGHVGLVVYPKGSDYHETGIIIHGTPSVSPLGAFADSYDTRVGTHPKGLQPNNTRTRGTSVHGKYYRTPVNQFPGSARPEPHGCGFEGAYADNRDDFSRPPPACVVPSTETCPYEPNAEVVITKSPVELLVTNPRGQRLETRDGKIIKQELDGGIHSMALPHDDGSFAWTLVLPKDDYDIELIGTAKGPYTLTMTTFDDNGNPVETVINGSADLGSFDKFLTPDTDGDTLGDNLEASLGTNPLLADSDGDGYSDSDEVDAQSNPLSANDIPTRSGLNIILIKEAIDAQ